MTALVGHMLWRDTAGSPPHWTYGTWNIRDGCIYRECTSRSLNRTANNQTVSGWFLPGLVDWHCHIGISSSGVAASAQGQIDHLRANRGKGVLLLRDCGSPVTYDELIFNESLPRVIRCGRHIARPKRYLRGLANELELVEDLPEALVQQATRSDGWVKIVGDWIDRSGGSQSDLKPLWPRTILQEAVEAVHSVGAKIAVHAFGTAVIDDLLDAGVDSIEHGSGMSTDHLSEAERRGILVTPTLCQVELFDVFAGQAQHKYPMYAKTMRELYIHRREHYERLFDSGVMLIPGTDAGGYQKHGSLPQELIRWARMGCPTDQIIDNATWKSRDLLGYASLEEGAPADVVCYKADPRRNIEILNEPSHIFMQGVL